MKKTIIREKAEEKYYSDYYLNDHKKYFSSNTAKKEVGALIRWFGRNPSSVCDVACGDGRHLAEFQKLGVKNGYGFDFSKALIKEAKGKISNRGNYKVEQKSFSEWRPILKQYDIVYSLFSAIGYCYNDDEAESLIRKMVLAVKPKGIVCIDTDNIFRLIRTLEKKNKKRLKSKEKLKFDTFKYILFSRDERDQEILVTKTKYYSSVELVKMFEKAGISRNNIEIKGDFSGKKYTYLSNRLIIVAKK